MRRSGEEPDVPRRKAYETTLKGHSIVISFPVMPRLLASVIVVAVLVTTGLAHADDAVAKRITLLRSHEDFRVRTQAALALGASKDKRAVVPLCHALADKNRTVRIASASAIGRLKMGGQGCLQKRLSVEQLPPVKASIERALEALGGAQEAGPAINGSTKYYVALGKIVNVSTSAAAKVRENMVRSARSLDGFAVAPAEETVAQARALLAKHPQAKAYYLAPTMAKPVYQGGNLTIQLSVAMMTYPDKVMLGQFSVRLTQEGVSEPNHQAEQELMGMAAESAMQKFAKHAESLGS